MLIFAIKMNLENRTKFERNGIKSPLQESLENEGWKHLKNVDPKMYGLQSLILTGPNTFSRVDAVLIQIFLVEYCDLGFREVIVKDAYDSDGKPKPRHRAIYLKK